MANSVVLGGAGFIGSHLVRELINRGDHVMVVDNFCTGKKENLESLYRSGKLNVFEGDIGSSEWKRAMPDSVQTVFNLACPASPTHYTNMPLETLRAGSVGIWNLIEFAGSRGSRIVHTSTSEIYGDPHQHPQTEEYFGNVNCIGPRSCYDESKRFSEALLFAASNLGQIDVGIARIFNTYGPQMARDDGRLVSNLIFQALNGQPLTIYGSGRQTRSLCFVVDTVKGLLLLEKSGVRGPINIGNPIELSVLEIAHLIAEIAGVKPNTIQLAEPIDDPQRRCPSIDRARVLLGWEPEVDLRSGLEITVDWCRDHLGQSMLEK